ncbi:MAG: hypothetical protein ACI379_17345 [Nocardioides sp.]|uniref:hypothetical protein n=1 Tax=Nocardioides sp. TaxID=35761 RepID=UPI003EFCF3A1
MNDIHDTIRLDVRPEVEAFVASVRDAFSDLDPEEREELLGGLEADVSELVADHGPQALGDPAVYARELRSAAGLPEPGRTRRGVSGAVPVAATVEAWLDRARGLALHALDLLPWGMADVVRVLRPVWWLVRAWALVALVNIWWRGSTGPEFLPTGSVGLGVLILVVAGVLSVMVGTRRMWPARNALAARLVLLAVNALALVVAPALALDAYDRTYWDGYEDGVNGSLGSGDSDGLWLDGRRVCNLQPFDAEGNQLAAVQLFDQAGRAVDVDCNDAYAPGHRTTAYPWYLGDVARWNVFPQAERLQRGDSRGEVRDDAYDGEEPPGFPVFDRTTVPGVTHPLVPAEQDAVAEEEPADANDGKGDGKADRRRERGGAGPQAQ